jgi:hypothetical protein
MNDTELQPLAGHNKNFLESNGVLGWPPPSSFSLWIGHVVQHLCAGTYSENRMQTVKITLTVGVIFSMLLVFVLLLTKQNISWMVLSGVFSLISLIGLVVNRVLYQCQPNVNRLV